MTIKLPIPTDSPRDDPLVILAVNEQWVSLLYGMVTGLLDPEQWDTDDPTNVIEDVRELLDLMTCNVTGINVTASGTIEITFGSGDPVESDEVFVTDPTLNPDGTWSYYEGSSQVTINPPGDPNNIWIVPTNPEPEQICYAAWFLAREWADQLQDILQLIDVNETLLAESAELIGIIPVVGTSIEAVIEYLHEGLLQVVLDWCIANAMDDDALEVAANALYCALIQASPPYDDFWNLIDFPLSLPEIIWNSITDPASWENVKDILDWAYGQATGEFMGWVALRYMQVIEKVGSDLLGLTEPLENMIAGAMNRASMYTAPSCVDFSCADWTYIFDFAGGAQGWVGITYGDPPNTWSVFDANHWKSVYGWAAGNPPNYRARQNALKREWITPTTIKRVEFLVDYTACSNSNYGNPYVNNIHIYIGNNADNQSWNTTETGHVFQRTYPLNDITGIALSNLIGQRNEPVTVVNGENLVRKVKVVGTGYNPFLNGE